MALSSIFAALDPSKYKRWRSRFGCSVSHSRVKTEKMSMFEIKCEPSWFIRDTIVSTPMVQNGTLGMVFHVVRVGQGYCRPVLRRVRGVRSVKGHRSPPCAERPLQSHHPHQATCACYFDVLTGSACVWWMGWTCNAFGHGHLPDTWILHVSVSTPAPLSIQTRDPHRFWKPMPLQIVMHNHCVGARFIPYDCAR